MARLDGLIRGRIEPQGPFVHVMVMATHHRVTKLKEAGLKPPAPMTIRALVDTGASCSCVDLKVAEALGLEPTGGADVHTPTTGPTYVWRNQYDATAILAGDDRRRTRDFTVGFFEADLASEGSLAIVGWDVLSGCILTCNGPARTFSLRF